MPRGGGAARNPGRFRARRPSRVAVSATRTASERWQIIETRPDPGRRRARARPPLDRRPASRDTRTARRSTWSAADAAGRVGPPAPRHAADAVRPARAASRGRRAPPSSRGAAGCARAAAALCRSGAARPCGPRRGPTSTCCRTSSSRPSRRVLHGSPRLLLADAVGLGKTIQAGLVLAELASRHALERALILTPPGPARSVGRRAAQPVRPRRRRSPTPRGCARCARSGRASLNPWSMPGVLIASIDFAKRPEVRRSLDDVSWDLVDRRRSARGVRRQRPAGGRASLRLRAPGACCC